MKTLLCLVIAAVLVLPGGVAFGQTVEERINALEKKVGDVENKANQAFDLARGFEFHGYARSGQGMTNKGGRMENFANASHRFRLGNENDNWIENAFVKNFFAADGSYFKVGTLIAYGGDIATGENELTNADNRNLMIRESYVEGGGFSWLPKGMNLWAGNRYYRRHDIHIIDYFLLDTSAYGGGFQELPLGEFGKMSVAYLATSSGTRIDNVGQELQNAFDVRVEDIKLGEFATSLVQVMPMWRKGGTVTTTDANGVTTAQDFKDLSGIRFALFINPKIGDGGFMGLGKGFTQITAQYGKGLGTQPDLTGIWPGVGTGVNTDDAWAFRASLTGVSEIADKFSFMPVALYNVADNGASTNPKTTEFYLGVRPIYQLSPMLALVFETGGVYFNQDGGNKGWLYKATIAPTIRPATSFWARPELRAFISYSKWDDALKGSVGGNGFTNETNGINIGLQGEAWW